MRHTVVAFATSSSKKKTRGSRVKTTKITMHELMSRAGSCDFAMHINLENFRRLV